MFYQDLKKFSLTFVLFIFIVFYGNSQESLNVESLSINETYDNVLIKKLNSDKNSSTFLIFIKKEVKLHKHLSHSETIYVVDGSGKMVMGDKNLEVKKGDVIFIPENTPHSVIVTSEQPLKVISTQAPEFDGKDRVFIE